MIDDPFPLTRSLKILNRDSESREKVRVEGMISLGIETKSTDLAHHGSECAKLFRIPADTSQILVALQRIPPSIFIPAYRRRGEFPLSEVPCLLSFLEQGMHYVNLVYPLGRRRFRLFRRLFEH